MSKKSESAEPAAVPPRPGKKPRTHRELAQAVFAAVNPVIVARGLLNSESEAVKVRALETFADWAFGAPDAAASNSDAEKAIRVVCSLPRPAREAPAWASAAESSSQPESPSQVEEDPIDPTEEP